MLSTDKSITIGMGVVTAATLYYLGGQNLPTKSLYSTLGGITATTLFQAYYPSCLGSLKEKCGQKLPKAMLCLSSVMVFIGGYVGGLSNRVNLLATSIFMVAQFVGAKIAHPYINNQYKKEVEVLCTQVENAISEGKLADAETLIEQGDKVEAKRAGLKGYTFAGAITPEETLDNVKAKLVEAYLNQAPPDFKKAKKFAEIVKDKCQQVKAQISVVTKGVRLAQNPLLTFLGDLYDIKPSREVMLKLIQLKEEGLRDEKFIKVLLEYGARCVGELGDKVSLLGLGLEDPEIVIEGKSPSLVLYLLKNAFAFKQNKVARDLVELCSDNDVKIQAAILSAKHFGKENLEAAKLHLQSALEVVKVLPDEDRKLLAFKEIVEVQRQLDLNQENAIQVAQTLGEGKTLGLLWILLALLHNREVGKARKLLTNLEGQFDTLSVFDRLAIMECLKTTLPTSLFTVFEKSETSLWEKDGADFHARALIILAKARFERGEINLAKELLTEVEKQKVNHPESPKCSGRDFMGLNASFDALREKKWKENWESITADLQKLKKSIRESTQKKESWFSWAS